MKIRVFFVCFCLVIVCFSCNQEYTRDGECFPDSVTYTLGKTIKGWRIGHQMTIGRNAGSPHIAVSDDNKWLLNNNYNNIQIRELKTGKLVREVKTSIYVNEIQISNDNSLIAVVSCSRFDHRNDCSIHFWDFVTGEKHKSILKLRGKNTSRSVIHAFSFTADSKHVVGIGRERSQAFVWNISTGSLIRKLGRVIKTSYRESGVSEMAISIKENLVAFGYLSGTTDLVYQLFIYNYVTGNHVRSLSVDIKAKNGRRSWTFARFSFSPSGRRLVMISGSIIKETLAVLDLNKDESEFDIVSEIPDKGDLKKYNKSLRSVTVLKFTNSENFLIMGAGNGSIRFWDIQKKKVAKEISMVKFTPIPSSKCRVENDCPKLTICITGTCSGLDQSKGHGTPITNLIVLRDRVSFISSSYLSVKYWSCQ